MKTALRCERSQGPIAMEWIAMSKDRDTSAQLVKFNFHGDELDVVATPDGEHWSVLARLCEPLEIDVDGQRRKLLSMPWARTKIILAHDSSGRVQELFCLSLRSIAGWLFTMNAGKIGPHLRDRLALYQSECADVLADHFLGARGRATVEQVVAPLRAELEALRQAVEMATRSQGPMIGPGAARIYVLDPLKEIARVKAKAIRREDPTTIRALRFLAERALRTEIGFAMVANQRWSAFPAPRLGEAALAVGRMMHEARALLEASEPKLKQLPLKLVKA
jgi:hypothetical protein